MCGMLLLLTSYRLVHVIVAVMYTETMVDHRAFSTEWWGIKEVSMGWFVVITHMQ